MKSLLTRAALGAFLLSLFSGCSLIVDTDSLQSGTGQFAVGLSTYWPVVGENVQAIPAGPGSGGTVNYQWYRNDEPVDGATGSTLSTAGWAGDDTLTVDAWTGSEADKVTVGPVTVLSLAVRWRPLQPNSMNNSPSMVTYEASKRRWLAVQEGLVWEYTIEDDALTPRPLRVGGTFPDTSFAPAFMDDVNHRLFVLASEGGLALTEIHVLDTSRRGAEEWSVMALPTAIDIGFFPSSALDPSGTSAWIFGINSTDTGQTLARIDFSEPGLVGVTTFTVEGANVPYAMISTLVVDPTNPERLLLFGGLDREANAAILNVGLIDIAGGTATYSEGAPMPQERFYSIGAADPSDGTVLLMFGVSGDFDNNAPPAPFVRYDVAADSFEELGASPVVGLLGSAVPDPERGPRNLLVHPGIDISDGAELDVTQIMTTTFGGEEPAPLAAYAAPSARSGMGSSGRSSTLRVAGGQLADSNSVSGAVWDLDLNSMTWAEFEPADDPVAMGSPGPRAELSPSTSGNWGGDTVFYFGGVDANGDPASDDVWELHRDGYWLHRTKLMAGDPEIPGNGLLDIRSTRGAAQFFSGCGANTFGVFGGVDSTGTVVDMAYMYVCPVGSRLRGCYWEPMNTAGELPQRAYSAAALDEGNNVWFWGGFDASGNGTNSGSSLAHCSGSATWSPLVVDSSMMPMGMQPMVRGGHTMTYVEPSSGELESWIVFGGSRSQNDTDEGEIVDDAFSFVGTGPTTRRAEPLVPVDSFRPVGRVNHAAIWDRARDRLVIFGGEFDYDERSDVWELLVP